MVRCEATEAAFQEAGDGATDFRDHPRWSESTALPIKSNKMIPADLRAICDSLNDERGTGGRSRLARLLGWQHSTVWRKLNGKSPITESDALAIQKALK